MLCLNKENQINKIKKNPLDNRNNKNNTGRREEGTTSTTTVISTATTVTTTTTAAAAATTTAAAAAITIRHKTTPTASGEFCSVYTMKSECSIYIA